MAAPNTIYVRAFAEDALLAHLTRRLLGQFGDKYSLIDNHIKITRGKAAFEGGGIRWNRAAKNLSANRPTCFLAMRDLDDLAPPQSSRHCPDSEIKRLLGNDARHDNFLLRFAVAESENWLLADYDGLCAFLSAQPQSGIRADEEISGKQAVIAIAARSHDRILRASATMKDKPGYVFHDKLAEFARDKWDLAVAAKNSKSLRRTLARLATFSLQPR